MADGRHPGALRRLAPDGAARELAGYAAYGYCRSQHRFFWGFRLILVCAPDGMPIGFDLVAANVPERHAATEILERLPLAGRTIIADKGFPGPGSSSSSPRSAAGCGALTAQTSHAATAR